MAKQISLKHFSAFLSEAALKLNNPALLVRQALNARAHKAHKANDPKLLPTIADLVSETGLTRHVVGDILRGASWAEGLKGGTAKRWFPLGGEAADD